MGSILVMSDLLKTPGNPNMSSVVHRIRFGSVPEPRPILGSSDLSAMYDAPYHAPRMVSSVLDTAVVSKWTSVSASDNVLREILRCYFTSTYVFIPFFHKRLLPPGLGIRQTSILLFPPRQLRSSCWLSECLALIGLATFSWLTGWPIWSECTAILPQTP